jgi:AraC-like DNA-binding protein
MAIFANIARHCLGIQWAPEEVHFEHPRPPLWREHERVFKARIRFSQPTNAVVFRKNRLDRPMPHGDLKLLDILCASMIELGRRHAAVTFVDRAIAEIRARLPDGNPYLDDISASLGIARWTLQRRLIQENLTFSELVALTRKELALKYIAQRYIPISEIATLLGYSETSAFTRAFKAWTGMSPNQHRNAGVG